MLSTFNNYDYSEYETPHNGLDGHHYSVNIVKAPKPHLIGIYFSADKNGRFVVKSLEKGSPARLCGKIQKGDVIVSMNGKSCLHLSKENMLSLVENLPINKTVEIQLFRLSESTRKSSDGMDRISLNSGEFDHEHTTFAFPAVSSEEKEKLFSDLGRVVKNGDTDGLKECMNRHFEQTYNLFNEAPCDPLHLACASGYQDLVVCLSGIIDVNKISINYGGTPLYVATKHNQLAIVEILIDNKAQQMEKLWFKNAPLNVAIENGYTVIAKMLEAQNQQLKEDPNLQFYLAFLCCAHGQLELLKLWWRSHFDPNENLKFAVHQNKPTTLLSVVFQEKANVQENPNKSKDFRDIVRYLYDKGAVITEEIACTFSNDVFQFLKSKNKDNFPSVVNWSSKHLGFINFDSWLLNYTDNIVELNLSGNKFSALPLQIPWHLPNIERLLICRCQELISLPDTENPLFCSRLTKIIVSGNSKLASIPLCWMNTPNLRHLDFSSNSLSTLPFRTNELWACKQLNTLHLQNNKLTHIPEAIYGAVNLKILFLADNELDSLPPAWNCPLTKLDVSCNNLTSLPDNIRKYWHRSLQHLNLNFNKLKKITPEITGLIRLTELNLANNQIDAIDCPENWQCKRLRTLNLSHNRLGGDLVKSTNSQQTPVSPVSNWLFANKNLVRSDSNPAMAPSVESNGSRKSNQNTSQNVVDKDVRFPTIFAEKINSLNLSNNNFRSVPKELCKLNALTELDLSENPYLRQLPPEMGRLQNLERLTITKLNIENLPNNMNPKFTDKPSTSAILTYLRSKLRREETCNRIKVIVLGKEGSGKSTLISNLVGAKNTRKQAISPVSTYWWSLDPPPEKRHKKDVKTLQLCMWELSEPETYNQLHQCFMNGITALFVLVIRVDGYSFPDISSWLLNIKLRAPRAHVLLVGTFVDKLSENTNFKTEMRKKSEIILELCARLLNGPKIIDFIGVSANSTSSFNAIKYAIYDHCWQILKNRKVPLSYNKIHLSVLQEKANRVKAGLTPIVTKDQLWDIIKNTDENDIEYGDEEELNNVADLLHDSGVLLHYSLNIRSLAIMCYYLDPEWLAEKMMRIVGPQGKKRKLTVTETVEMLRTKRNADNGRKFSSESESSSTPTDISELMATHIIEIMQRFELLLLLNKNLVLIPCKLPAEAPEMDLNLRGPMMSRLYRMGCTPSGFWSRLIVRLLVRMEDSLPHRRASRSRSASEKTLSSSMQRTVTLRHTMTSYDVGDMWQLMYWAEGVILQVKEGCLKVESLKQSFLRENFVHDDVNGSEGVLITWQSRHNGFDYSPLEVVLFTIAVDEADLLISEWFPDFDFGEHRIQRYVLCPSCLATLMQKQISFDPNVVHLTDCVGCFPLEALAACSLKSGEIACPLHPMEEMPPLKSLVPDLLLTDIPNLLCLNPNDLLIDTYVTRGGQAALFHGHYLDQEVAIKTFLAVNSLGAGRFGEGRHALTQPKNPTASGLLFDQSGDKTDVSSVDNELPALFALQRMRREVIFVASLHHPCIISIVGAMVHPGHNLCFALEFAALGNLANYLSRRRETARNVLYEPIDLPSDDAGVLFGTIVPRQLIYKFAWQVIVALQYLHKQGVLFRDLKSENVLVWSEQCDALVNVKLSDYGISCYSGPQGILGNEGTPGFQAPEVLKNMTYDDKADIFSYGMVIYELLSGLPPFNDVVSNAEIKKLVKNGKRPSLKEVFVNPDFWPLIMLMENCWAPSPVERPSADEIRQLMEDYSFAILRQQLTIKSQDYFSVASIRGDRHSLIRRPSKKQLLVTMRLQAYPLNANYAWLLFGHEEWKRFHVLDVDKCRFVEKDFLALPGATTVTSCVYKDCIILINQDERLCTTIEIFKYTEQNYTPLYLERISLDNYLLVTSCCSMEGPPQDTETFLLFLGLKNGEIIILSIDFESKELLYQSCWTFSSGSCGVQAIIDYENRLFVASAGFLFVLNFQTSSVEAVISAFKSGDIDFMTVHRNSNTVWCASKREDTVTVYSTNSPYGLLIAIDIATNRGSELLTSPTNVYSLSMENIDADASRSVCGLLHVKDTAWLALSDGLLLIVSSACRDYGRIVAVLQTPKDFDYKTCTIQSVQLINDAVVVMAKYVTPTVNRKLSGGSDAEYSFDASRRPSCSRTINVASLSMEKTKIFIWEAADLSRLLNLRQTWISLRNAVYAKQADSSTPGTLRKSLAVA